MKNLRLSWMIVIALLVASAALVVGIVYRTHFATKVDLGPMPSEDLLPDPLSRQTATQMRQWVQNLPSDLASQFNTTGKIVLPWNQVETLFPEQAHIIDSYVEKRRQGMAEAMSKGPKGVPARLAQHHAPDTVTLERLTDGKCRVVTSSKEGIEHCALEIAAQ